MTSASIESIETAKGAGFENHRIRVSVLMFAKARELAGLSEVSLEVDEGATTADCLKILVSTYDKLQSITESMVLALNHDYVENPVVVNDGDELALIPPISGG
ncbi:hypothetical protein O6H91_04G140900 [Diphasiastrum complanatum]|uniref:Uncharacterized protein n=1 Tax=Diphasiastrum complanatum TaxID=34168 RepID=A0ACC2E2T4_DIPCM|nr:hypothetical protein O6H91_04G140900 [Diphasiastrum complanatum]